MANNRTLEAIVSIAGQLDPSLQRSLTSATKQFSGMKIGMAAVGTAAVAATAAVVKFGADSVKAAMNYETSFAQTSTLLQGTEAELQAYSDSIVDLSNETGIAANELSESVYNALSAGVDQAHAVEFAETSAKLASGGFTDATTAVDVLTTALNAYGLEADQAGKISDYLIVTQNLGKTTVDELASSVGKVIPIASAYGVEMDNLSTAYAQLTAGGIATAEAGTYLKAMLNELGDSGSVVSEVLNEQTGMSFAELTESGKSLGDIMAILGDSVGGDAGAFNELWSSSEAGVGALSLLNGGAEAYNETLAAMQNSSGETDKAYDTMTDTLEHQIQVIKNLGQNFMISIGQKLLPVVKDAAEKLIPAIEAGLENLEPVISNIYNALSPVIGAFGDIAASLLPAFQSGLSGMGGLWEKIAPMMQEIANNIMPPLKEVFGKVGDLFVRMQPLMADFASKMIPHIMTLIKTLSPIFGMLAGAISPILDMVGNLAESLFPALANIIGATMPRIQAVASIIVSVLGNALSFIMPIIENIMAAFTGICDFINNIFAGNWQAAWENIQSIFGNVAQALVGLWKAPINAIVSIVNGVIEGINNCGFTIPDWVPIVGGQAFKLDIPLMPTFAEGGFTSGPSIAGEAGTEAVISFDKSVRDENLSYWASAGRMLGVDDGIISAFEQGSVPTSNDNISFTFAPQITIQGTGDAKEDILAALRKEEEEFIDMIEEMLSRRGGERYVYS